MFTGVSAALGAAFALFPVRHAAPVSIEGAVNHPRTVTIERPQSLRSVIDRAGGFRKDADLHKIVVTSAGGETKTVDLGSLSLIASVTPGDVVNVPVMNRKDYVFLEGSVANRGSIPFKPGMTLAEALASAQPIVKKDTSKVTVTRQSEDGKESRLSYDLLALSLAREPVLLQPADRVSVPFSRSYQTSDRELVTILIVALVLIAITR